ncbi:MAG: chaperone modulator CbpM [Pseudomonadota bacterium]
MTQSEIVHGELIDELALSFEELCSACGAEPRWIVTYVEAQLLAPQPEQRVRWRFGSADLTRARRMAAAQRMFDVDADAAAFMADLIEEVTRLRHLSARR